MTSSNPSLYDGFALYGSGVTLVTVRDDDVDLALSAAVGSAVEGDTGNPGQLSFTVTRNGGRSVTTTLDIQVAGADDAPVATGELSGAITEAAAPAGTLTSSGCATPSWTWSALPFHTLTGATGWPGSYSLWVS